MELIKIVFTRDERDLQENFRPQSKNFFLCTPITVGAVTNFLQRLKIYQCEILAWRPGFSTLIQAF